MDAERESRTQQFKDIPLLLPDLQRCKLNYCRNCPNGAGPLCKFYGCRRRELQGQYQHNEWLVDGSDDTVDDKSYGRLDQNLDLYFDEFPGHFDILKTAAHEECMSGISCMMQWKISNCE